MRTFTYKGYQASGSEQQGHIEALTAKDARDQLAVRGIWVEVLEESRAAHAPWPVSVRSMFYRELAALLRAGMPLVPALGMLLETPELGPVYALIAGIRDKVRDGGRLSKAMEDATPTIRAFEVAAIDVAERTGTLDEILDRLSDLLDARQRLRERVQQALAYPFLVVVLGSVVGVIMLGVLLPRMENITGGTVELPWLTRMMLLVGEWLFPWGLSVLLVLLLGVGLAGRRRLQEEHVRIRLERAVWRLPLRGLYAAVVAGRFARTLAVLLRAGVSLVDGVALACKATGSQWCEKMGQEASTSIRHGQTLEASIREIPLLADVLAGWVAVGEASGDLARMLDHAAYRCDRRIEHQMARFLAVLEPVLLLLVGGFVLLVTLAVLLPVFSLTDAVLQ